MWEENSRRWRAKRRDSPNISMLKEDKKVVPGIEPGLLESESRVITITLHNLSLWWTGYFLVLQAKEFRKSGNPRSWYDLIVFASSRYLNRLYPANLFHTCYNMHSSHNMEPQSNEEWQIEEGIPQVEDPFIQQYLRGRSSLILEEQKQRHGG